MRLGMIIGQFNDPAGTPVSAQREAEVQTEVFRRGRPKPTRGARTLPGNLQIRSAGYLSFVHTGLDW
jgi:hypothetical protein